MVRLQAHAVIIQSVQPMHGMDLQTYHDYTKYIKDEFGVNYDIIVAEFIDKWF
ncbi:MAG: hypothetical protein ACKPKO_52110 [Candidatus Fonsibacter sp.]